ncbi:helix-turn-helix domain-containing protein [Streptomyces rubiginosohelvolus]
MGNHQQPWMFAEDRFGRRMRKEREDRAMTQSDVANVLAEEHDLKLHATAIAKMEQRDVERPRTIRLSEARAIADMFGLTVDEMMSSGEGEIQAVAREFAAIGAQAESLKAQTASAMQQLQSVLPAMSVPDGQLPPEIRVARNQILSSLASLEADHLTRINQGHELISRLHRAKAEELGADYQASDPGDLRSLQLAALLDVWVRVSHEQYPSVDFADVTAHMQLDKGESTLQLAARLQPPGGKSGPHWAMAATIAHGLWGHGVPVELQERVPDVIRRTRQGGLGYAKYEALAEMAQEVQVELDRIWPAVVRLNATVESIWADPDALRQWARDTAELASQHPGAGQADATGA